MLSEAADNSALEACPDSVQFPGSIRWGAAHFFEPIISLRPCLRGELRSMPRTTCPSGVAYHPGPRTRRTITSPGSRDGSWLPPDHAAGAKLRCLRLLRAIRGAISPANRSMGNDRSPANVQKTTFSCDRQHPLRTVRNTFALHGSSTQQRPLNERGRSLIQVQLRPTRYWAYSRFARRWKIHQACGKPHQRLAPSSFALLPASV